MLNTSRSIAGLGILVALAGLPVSAQPTAATPAVQPGQAPAVRTAGLIPCERLIKADIVGSDKKDIGEVNDLIVARRSGRVIYALVGQGGVLGVGEHVVAVPFAAFGWSDEDRKLTLPMTRDRLKAAPAVDGDDWKTLTETSRSDEIARYFNTRAGTIDESDSGLHSQLPTAEWPLLRVSELRGKKLMSDDGRELGTVNDLIIDASSGRVAFGVVTFGGTLGFGADKVPIPWPLFDVNKDGGLFAVKIDKEQVMSAPRLKDKDWAELKDSKFAPGVYAHYGVNAPWIERISSAPAPSDASPTSLYQQAYTIGNPGVVTGKITSINECTPMKGVPDVTCISIQSDAGGQMVAHLAPKWYLEQQGVKFKTGDAVTINGRWADIEGSRYLIATSVSAADGKALVLRQGDGVVSWTWR